MSLDPIANNFPSGEKTIPAISHFPRRRRAPSGKGFMWGVNVKVDVSSWVGVGVAVGRIVGVSVGSKVDVGLAGVMTVCPAVGPGFWVACPQAETKKANITSGKNNQTRMFPLFKKVNSLNSGLK